MKRGLVGGALWLVALPLVLPRADDAAWVEAFLLLAALALVPLAWLDVPWMRASHGTANAIGFGFGGLLGWTLALRPAAEDGRR